MKRFLSVAVILLGCLPVGVSLVGCGTNVSNFCDATDSKRTSEVATIVLKPEYSSVSLAYMQTRLLSTPAAYNCLGSSVGVAKYSWASSNPNLLDVSPSGNLCSGTWNRNTGGGVADYTICTPPTNATIQQLLTEGNGTYSNFYVTVNASANGISSNPVTVYSHPTVTSILSYTVDSGTTTTSAAKCVSPFPADICSNTTAQSLSPSKCYAQQNPDSITTYCGVVCAEGLTANGSIGPVDITPAAGIISFAASNSTVASITLPQDALDSPSGIAKPVFPGATLVTASVSGVTGEAGIYSTCAPGSVAPGSNSTSGGSMLLTAPNTTSSVLSLPVNQARQLSLSVLDSTNTPVSLSGVSYTSTTPRTLGVTATGSVTPAFGGNGDVYAACLPPACNPSPISDIGLFATTTALGGATNSGGSGVSLVSNPINVVTPGTETTLAYLANFDQVDYPNANYFAVFNSTNNTIAPVTTPNRPNSMVLNQAYTTLYIGTNLGLLEYAVASGSPTLSNGPYGDQSVPGRVVAVSPDGTALIISGWTDNDPVNGTPQIYIYSTATASSLPPHAGTAYSAQWSADGNTVYIAGGNQEYVYSKLTGWSVYPTANGETNVQDVAVLTPPVGAFFSGSDTAARTYCPDLTPTAPVFNPMPPTSETGQAADRLGMSTDGLHLFGATTGLTGNFNDYCIGLPTTTGTTVTGVCTPAPVAPIAACNPTSATVPGGFAVTATDTPASAPVPAGFNVTGIPVASNTPNGSTTTSYTAFVTYSNCTNTESITESCTGTATGTGVLPYYVVTQGSAGAASTLTLTNPNSAVQPIAPTAGAVTPDNSIAYIATSGDNALHVVTINTTTGAPTENVATNPPITIGIPSGTGTPGATIPVDKILIRPYRANP
jgi:hypothetical protein